MTLKNFMPIIKNSALVIFFSISQLGAMEVVPEEQMEAIPVEQVILKYLALTKETALLGQKAISNFQVPEGGITYTKFCLLAQGIISAAYQNLMNERVKLQSLLPTGLETMIAKRVDEELMPVLAIYSLSLTHVKIYDNAHLNRVNKTDKEMTIWLLQIIFYSVKTFYPALVPITFEEFWNDGKVDEDH